MHIKNSQDILTLLVKVTARKTCTGDSQHLLQMINERVFIFIKGGVESKSCKSISFFRHGQRTELTIARGASAPWTEYQSRGEEK